MGAGCDLDELVRTQKEKRRDFDANSSQNVNITNRLESSQFVNTSKTSESSRFVTILGKYRIICESWGVSKIELKCSYGRTNSPTHITGRNAGPFRCSYRYPRCCCDGSSPMWFQKGNFIIGKNDVLLGVVYGCDFYMAKDQYHYWKYSQHIIDVTEGRGASFSLEIPMVVRFLVKSRLFTDQEWAAIEAE